MKLRPFRAAVALTTALTTAAAPLLVGAQTSYEFKSYKQGLVVSGSTSAPEAPAPGTPPPGTPQPALQLSTSAINFGDVATHTTETRQVLVSNPGTGSLSFTAAPAVTGAAEFAAGVTSCGATLAAGADCLAEATFSPTAAGTFNGVLTFTSVLTNSPHEITLVGTAFNPVSLASATLPTARVGKDYSYDFKQLLNVSNEDSPDKSQATWNGSGTLPAGLSFNNSTGVLAGTPSAVNAGASYTVTGTYKNNQGQQVYTIKVGEVALDAVQVAAGQSHSCALTPTGSVACWGTNNLGQLGDGTGASSSTPVPVTGLDSGVASISAGVNYTCAVTTAGGVKCWGVNNYGQLGDGTKTNRIVPVNVTGLSSEVERLSVGGYHACVVTTAGAAKCWGYNLQGQLGNGTLVDSSTPVAVSGLSSGVALVATGSFHSCAAASEGGVKCWGRNMSGELGDGTKTLRAIPVPVTGLDAAVVSLGGGYYHTCATTAGAALCWGNNSNGQLGDGTTTSRTTPMAVTGLGNGVASIAVGDYHTCAVAASGEAQCWGKNGNGQLGDGTTIQRAAPVAVTGLGNGVASIAAGTSHTCAVTHAGSVKCWGNNGSGQLGDGTTTQRTIPANVLP